MRRPLVSLAIALGMLGCSGHPAPPPPRELPPLDSTAVRQLDAFRAQAGPAPAHLAGERTRDALVQAFVAAVNAKDTASLGRLALSPAEFAWFYYPDAPLSRPPYGLDAETMWTTLSARSLRGAERTLRAYGGHLAFASYECEATPDRVGALTVWTHCTVTHLVRGSEVTEPLFGSIVERDGWFKFVGLANGL